MAPPDHVGFGSTSSIAGIRAIRVRKKDMRFKTSQSGSKTEMGTNAEGQMLRGICPVDQKIVGILKH